MSLIAHAKNELERVIDDPDVILMYLEIVATFDAKKGSGEPIDVDILAKLFRREHVAPITTDPTEWVHVGSNEWRNLRNDRVLSDDGGRTYIIMDDDPDSEDELKRYVSAKPKKEKP